MFFGPFELVFLSHKCNVAAPSLDVILVSGLDPGLDPGIQGLSGLLDGSSPQGRG